MVEARIAAVEAFVLAGDKDLGGGGGPARGRARARGAPRAGAMCSPFPLRQDALAVERHWAPMDGSMRLRGHVAGYLLEALSGVDIALWHLAGRLLGLPVDRLLGGPFHTSLPTCAAGVPGTTSAERGTPLANRW